ncbi:ATP-binding protein [Micromonospora sp. NPDC049089]|uniref:AlbA family DNA-binding domain-containing protein n=1 Tax=Micromonospora sp. NPDC049089 TaxID=3155496 RepID=UPI0033E37C97
MQPESREPVVVEAVVNREKLRELLALEAEYSALDYKSGCNLAEKRHQVEFAKDVGAMSVRGGFLIVGVDGLGRPTGDVTADQAEMFDEARLRPKLMKWLPDGLEISAQVHEIDGNFVALIYVAPNPTGCAFFRADGQYEQPGKGLKVAFREGEAFFRYGTESTRLNQQGLELVVRQRVEQVRSRWEDEHAATYRSLAEGLQAGFAGQRVSRGAAIEFNLTLELDILTEAAIELLRAGDDIPLRRLLTRAVPEARSLYLSGNSGDLSRLLDRLACLAALFLELERSEWFRRTVATMLSIYGLGFENEPQIVDHPPPAAASLWLAIIERVLGIGSFAVRQEAWSYVGLLAVRRHPNMHQMYVSWIRHALTMAARAKLLTQRQASSEMDVSLLSLARETVRRLECLRPDADGDDEVILNGLAQFDFLSCVAALGNSENGNRGGVFYPNFARFRGTRTQPIAERLLREQEVRKPIFPDPSDQLLAEALLAVDAAARQEAFRFDGWEGYTRDVNRFIEQHLPR